MDLKSLAAQYGGKPIEPKAAPVEPKVAPKEDAAALAAKFGGVPIAKEAPANADLAAKFGGVPTPAEPSAWYERAADIFPAIGKGTVELAEMFGNRIGDIESHAMADVSKIGKKDKGLSDLIAPKPEQKTMPIGPTEGQKSTFKQAEEYLQSAKTPETQLAEAKTRDAKGFLNTAGAYLQNPSAIYTGIGESLPSMIGGAGIGKTLATKGVEPLLAASIGEGTIGAASTAQAISDQQGGKAPTLGQGAAALASGVFTAAFGQLGGKVAKKLGVEDIDKLLVAGATKEGAPIVASKITAALKGAISESAFEELPQSMQEQVMQNLATGRPWNEGVAEAGAAGFMTALPAGAIGGAYGQHKENKAAAAAAVAEAEATTEDNRPGRKEKIKDIHKELEALSKAAPVATAPTEEAPTEPPAPPVALGVIDETVLAGFKINRTSNAYKNLLGVDTTTPEGKQKFDTVLENYKGKIDEKAVDAFTQSIPQPTVEAPEVPNAEAGRIDSGTTGEGVQIPGQPSGEQVTGGTEQPIGAPVVRSRSAARAAKNGKVQQPAPLETQAVTPQTAKVGEPFKVGDATFVKTEDGKFERVETPIAEEAKVETAPKAEEVLREEPTPEPVQAEEVVPEEAAPDHIEEAKKVAKELASFDPNHPMIETLKDELAVAPEDVTQAKQELETLKATKEAKGETPLAEELATGKETPSDEEVFAKAKDTIGAFVRQNIPGVENIAPEDIVSPQQALASLVDIMHHVIKKGAHNFAQAMAHARRGLGAHGKAIPTAQYKAAYNAAMAKINTPKTTADYDKKLKETGTKKPRAPEENWGTRFMGAPVQTTGEIIQIIRSGLFSFDQATNKKILNAAREAGVSPEDYARISHEIQVSQAVNGASLSDLTLERGMIEYDPETYKFSITKIPESMGAIRQSLIDLAKQYKVPVEKFRNYASAAFIARRSAGLVTANEELVNAAKALASQGKLKEAKALVARNYKLVHLTQAQIDAGLDFFKDFPELEDTFNTWNAVRENILNFATEHGLFTEAQRDELLSVIDYVPFHRVEQILNKAGPKEYARGLLDAVKDPKKFKGSYQEVNDVFDNMERWLKYTIRKAINNSVAQSKLKYYQEFLPDDVKEVGLGEKHETNTVSIWQDGKIHRYAFQGVDGKAMVQGFSGLEPVVLGSANVVMRVFSRVASSSRANVVLNPVFAATQVFMDGASAMFTSQTLVPFAIPVQVVKEIVLTPLGLSSARKELKTKGIVGKHGYFDSFAKFDVATGEEAKRYGTFDKLLNAIVSPLHAIGLASDNVIRQAVYSQVMLETKDKALAEHLAAEVINFHRAGYWGPIRVVRQLAPFVNAGLQSLHITGSTILADGLTPQTKAKAAMRFVSTWAQVAGLTLLYAAMKSDDDDYKKLDPSERDRFIILNKDYKIPLRMDFYTYLAKAAPEHVFNLLIEQSEDPTKFRKAMKDGFLRALALPSANPTALTPFTEMAFNRDSYSGNPLINQNQQGLDPELQYNVKRTAEWAKFMGEQTGLSPIWLENFIQSYFSMSSMIVAAATNEYFAEKRGVTLPTKTTKEALLEYPSFSSFLVKDFGARNTTDFYELNDKVKSVVDTFKAYEKFDVNKAHEFLKKEHNQELMNMQKELSGVAAELSKLKAYEVTVREDRYHRWNADEKAAELRRLEVARQTMLGHQFDLETKKDRYVQQLRNIGGF